MGEMLKTPLIIDIETDGQPAQSGKLAVVGYQLADEARAHALLPTDWEPDETNRWSPGSDELVDMLADPERPIVSMTKFDPRYLKLKGWDIAGPLYDLQVMAWVLNENQMLSLDALAKRYLGLTMDKRLRRRNGKLMFLCDTGQLVPLEEAPMEELAAYCLRDVEAETRMFNTLRSRLEDTAWWDYFVEEEVPFTSVLVGMEVAGLPVDIDASEELRARLEVEHEQQHDKLIAEGSLPPGFNLNSGAQLAEYLYQKVAVLDASLTWDPYAVEALKSCLDGEHEDCPAYEDDHPELAEVTLRQHGVVCHISECLPDRFTVESLGRTQVHGKYTYRGRSLRPTKLTKSCFDKKCDHAKTGKPCRWSTSSPVLKANLEALQDPWVFELLGYRKVEKALTTYLRRFPELAIVSKWDSHEGTDHPAERRLYGRFNQTGTKTGRLSSSEPNLQNIPARGPLGEAIRSLFTGDLLVGDYSQLEPRLLAHFSQDPVLMRVYQEGHDIYNVTGSAIFGMRVEKGMEERDIAKVVFLGDQYGMGNDALAAMLTVNGFTTSPSTAKGYQQELHSLYRVAETWKEGVRGVVRRKGYVVTIGGRHRRLKAAFEDRRNWKNVGYGERQAVNAIIQGSAGDVVRKAMVECGRRFPTILRLLAQVHDELVWEKREYISLDALDWLREACEVGHGFSLSVPLVFEPHFGDSWFSAKEGGIELPEELLEETTGFEEE